MIAGEDGTIVVRALQFVEELVVADLELAAGTEPLQAELPRALYPPSSVSSTVGTERSLRHDHLATPHLRCWRGTTELITPVIAKPLEAMAEVYLALVMGLRDYCSKNGIERVYLGLSGGIDSTLVATGLRCPRRGTCLWHLQSQRLLFGAFQERRRRAGRPDRLALHDGAHRPSGGRVRPDARYRWHRRREPAGEDPRRDLDGRVQPASPSIVLACGNKSELAVGYSTIYGDAVGGYAPIKDVPKTWVWRLARWRNEQAVERGETPPIPENSIIKEPSAELRPGQKDTDSLPPYELLDDVLDDYVEGDAGHEEIVAMGFDPELADRVIRMVDRAEYKRRQYPPGTKISFKAFGRDRRLPITNGWREGR